MLHRRIDTLKKIRLSCFTSHLFSNDFLTVEDITDIHQKKTGFGTQTRIGSVTDIDEVIQDFFVLKEQFGASGAEELRRFIL
jgi:hypothetical protein